MPGFSASVVRMRQERYPLNIGIGLCLGMTPLAAYNYSSGNLGRMRASVRCARRIGIAVGDMCVALISLIIYLRFSKKLENTALQP